MTITVLPTRTDGSLGEPKEDPGLVSASKYQLLLDPEWNLAADLLVWLSAQMGLDNTTTSVRYILERLGNGNPRYFRHYDYFLRNGMGPPDAEWWDDAGVGAWVTTPAVAGGAVAQLDDVAGGYFQDWAEHFQAEHLPRLCFRVTMGSIHADAGVPAIGMTSAAGNDGFYVTYDSAVSAKWQVVTLVGGVPTATDVGPDVVADTEYEVDLQVEYNAGAASYDLRASIGGTSTYIAAGLAAATPWGRRVTIGVGGVGAVGKVIRVRRMLTEADFGA